MADNPVSTRAYVNHGSSVCAGPILTGPNKGQDARGTLAGYNRHRRSGEPACDDCLSGTQRYLTANRRKRLDHYRAVANNWTADNRERVRNSRLKYRYGLTLEDYETTLRQQGGACVVCGTTEPGGRGVFVVDHDHRCCLALPTCGECTRGLLCDQCNRTMGQFGDDPERLLAVVRYLKSHEGTR